MEDPASSEPDRMVVSRGSNLLRLRCWLRRGRVELGLGLGAAVFGLQFLGADQPPFSALVTNVALVQRLGSGKPDASYPVRLEGEVWWANETLGKLVLRDGTG